MNYSGYPIGPNRSRIRSYYWNDWIRHGNKRQYDDIQISDYYRGRNNCRTLIAFSPIYLT